MTDYFALFDESPRPWLDPDKLKTKFLTLSAQLHPDKIHAVSFAERESSNGRFAELSTAFHCLRNARDRLRHLLDLELGERPKQAQAPPEGLMEQFSQIAELRREVSALLTEAARVNSPLLRVRLFQRAQEWTDLIQAQQHRMRGSQHNLIQELQSLDAEWMSVANDPVSRGALLHRFEQVQQELSFYNRWDTQLQETVVRLSFLDDTAR